MLTPTDIFAARVPRYTSYPTAPHFHTGIDGRTYAGWLEALPPDMPLSLYLHVPFCDTLCWFCACHTTVVNNQAPVREYCQSLLGEIALVAARLKGRHPVTHIHWGGGSPTLVEADDMRWISATIRRLFDVRPDAEIAIEIDPRGFDNAQAAVLADCGFNRASIGLQDCDAKVQKAINRIQPAEVLRDAVDALRRHGIENINLDLVYGLPHQTQESFARNLDLALALEPSRLALFGYAHVPFFKKHQALIPQSALPDVEARLQLAQAGEDRLCAAGYQAIGLDHFAQPDDALALAAKTGALRRNFQGYTADQAGALIGLGASAVGRLPQGYVQNCQTVAAWRAALDADDFPVARGIALTPEDQLRRHVIEQLMCFLTVDLAQCCEDFGYPPDWLDWALPAMQNLVESRVANVSGRTVSIRPQARGATRLASAVFDAYLGAQSARHSLSA